MSRTQLLAAITKLEQRKAAGLNRPPLSETDASARAAALLAEVDHLGPVTPTQVRARRLQALINTARQRRDANDIEST